MLPHLVTPTSGAKSISDWIEARIHEIFVGVFIGALTFTGSVPFGKLQGIISSKLYFCQRFQFGHDWGLPVARGRVHESRSWQDCNRC